MCSNLCSIRYISILKWCLKFYLLFQPVKAITNSSKIANSLEIFYNLYIKTRAIF